MSEENHWQHFQKLIGANIKFMVTVFPKYLQQKSIIYIVANKQAIHEME